VQCPLGDQMPVNIHSTVSGPTCTFSQWAVGHEPAFVEALAWLYVQRQSHATAIIKQLSPGITNFIGKEIDNAIDVLRYKTDDIAAQLMSFDSDIKSKAAKTLTARVSHRDGLLFQHISWLAARIQYPEAEATAPHVRVADKGFDGFLIERPNGTAISRMILCEDKASTNPRPIITGQVWPEILAILDGQKDREIVAAVMALLSNLPLAEREEIIGATIWSKVKHFRVALAAGGDQIKNESYLHLFDGFEKQAAGHVSIRLAEVMPMPDVRAYLEDVALKVVERLNIMKAAHV
jgi:hypothetical protein